MFRDDVCKIGSVESRLWIWYFGLVDGIMFDRRLLCCLLFL